MAEVFRRAVFDGLVRNAKAIKEKDYLENT